MKKIHKLLATYNAMLYRIGLNTSLLYNTFAFPFSISIIISLFSLCFSIFPPARAYGVGVISSCLALLIGIQLTRRFLHNNASLLFTLLLMHCKVLGFAFSFIICYTFFNLSIFILVLGFITPLCILSIHILRYMLLPLK